MNESIFIDSSFWIALRNPKEQSYKVAQQIIARLVKIKPILVTTFLVACETHAYLSRSRKYRALVLDDIQKNPVFRIEAVNGDDESSAFELLRSTHDKSYSLCDAVSFVLMDRLGIKRALSFDDHFRQVGKFQIIDHPDAV